MPTNLLTGEVKSVAKDKPVNLLPDLTNELYKDKEKLPGIKREITPETILRPAPPERPMSQFMKRVSEFVGLRKSNEEKIAESEVIYSDAKRLSKEKNIPIDNAIRYERTRRESDVVGAIKVFGESLAKAPAEVMTSTLKAHQGAEGASVLDGDRVQEILRNARVDSNTFVQDVWGEYGERKILPGVPIKITDIAQLPQNLGFSLTSMGAGLAIGAPIAFAPIPGARVVAWGMGTAASGKVAFEMSTYEVMQSYLEFKDEESILKTGEGITAKEEKQLKEDFNADATKYGLWEAIPEALSNLAFAKLLMAPLTKMVGKALAGRIVTRLAGIYGEEFLTETITEKGQSAIMQKAGLEPATEPITWMEAFKRVAPQTFLLSTILAGTGAAAVTAKQKITNSLKREVGTDHPKYEKLVKDADKLIKEQATPPKVPEIGKVEGEIEAIVPEKVPEVEKPAEALPEPIVTEKSIQPEADKKAPLEKEIEAMELRGDKVASARKAIELGESIYNMVRGTLEIIAAEKDIPKVKMSEILAELNAEAGTNFKSIEDLQEFEKNWKSEKKWLERIIKEVKPEAVTRKETTILKEKVRNIERGIREGKIIARKEIKTVQNDVIKLFKEAKLDIPISIKSIQTQEQLARALPAIRETIARLEVAAGKRVASVKIKRELKTTKPLKVGQRRIGKFDYETNKMFDAIRGYNKLTQEKAQIEFDKFPEEVTNEIDLIKKRFLSLKANGASASLEIHNQVYADIMRIKELGKQAKNEADLEKRLNRQERVENALSSIDRIKADKKTVKTKIGNVYRKAFSNIYSMLNSIGGKAFAETYDPELSENKRNTATYKKTVEITQQASKIYDEKNIMRMFETMSMLDYEITDIKDGLTTELSKLELIDIYNSIKNDKKKQDYYEAFGEDQVETLMRKLTPQDELFGDSLQEAVQDYRKILNKRNIEITGRDLGFIENYWPATSEFQVSVIDDMRVQGETPSALKERAKTRVVPVPKNAWYKAQRHIAQAEHVDNLSREYEALKRLFNDRKVKHAMKQKFGEDIYNTLITQIDNISLNKQTERIDAISSMFQRAINNWVTAKIALNPSTFVRQLMSVGNYAENMNPVEWTAGFLEGILSPKKTFDYMWKNAPFLEARFNKGYSEALKEAIKGAESISVNRKSWTKFLTALVRGGDITAIIYGGFPLIQSELAKGKSTQEAVDTFERATLKAQQSGLSSSISQFQNSKNPFTRLFLAFKNTANQYFRKMADAIISYQNGDIPLEQFAKTMTIYVVVQPILYISAGYMTKTAFSLLGKTIGLREDDEDYEELLEKFLNDIIIQMIVSPVNAIPVIDDAMRTVARKLLSQKIYKVFSTPLFDDLEKGLRALTKKEVTGEDYLKTATSILEPVTAAPIATGIRYYEILTGKKGKKKYK